MLQKVITVSNGAKSGKPINFNYIMEASNVEQERLDLILKKTVAGVGIILIIKKRHMSYL